MAFRPKSVCLMIDLGLVATSMNANIHNKNQKSNIRFAFSCFCESR